MANPDLPHITAPDGVCFLADGHSIEEDSVYAQVPYITGHSRARRVFTVPERVVQVRALLEPALLAEVDDWFENALQSGALEWSAQVRNQGTGPMLLWWRARWIEYQVEMLHKGRGIVTGTLLLTGEGSVEGPETGALAMEVGVALLDISSSLSLPIHLAMEVNVKLLQPLLLGIEVLVELLSDYIPTGARITEDDELRITETGSARVIE